MLPRTIRAIALPPSPPSRRPIHRARPRVEAMETRLAPSGLGLVGAVASSRSAEYLQADERESTAVSNILKTEHDTVKSSISNVR